MTFEASGYYMYHPFAMERMARHLPGVKLVVMLRDPGGAGVLGLQARARAGI